MLAYMNAHYADEALSLQYIADNVVYMNADYIGREFTRTVGQKFSSQLLSIRMEHAKLLIRSDPSLHSYEIAEKVGLGENPHYFSQLFRKYTGMTPKDYRKQLDEQTGRGKPAPPTQKAADFRRFFCFFWVHPGKTYQKIEKVNSVSQNFWL